MWFVVTMDEFVSGPHVTKRDAMNSNHFYARTQRIATGVYLFEAEGYMRYTSYYIGTEDALRQQGFGHMLDGR